MHESTRLLLILMSHTVAHSRRHNRTPQIEVHMPYSNSCAFIGNEDHAPKDEPRRLWRSEVYGNSEIFPIIVRPSTVIYESYYSKYHTRRSLNLHNSFKIF